jgi:hypothetical protein
MALVNMAPVNMALVNMALVNMALVNMALVNMEKILNRPGLEIAHKLCFHKRNAATVSPVRTRAINLHL